MAEMVRLGTKLAAKKCSSTKKPWQARPLRKNQKQKSQKPKVLEAWEKVPH
jgi:hypothetical protein